MVLQTQIVPISFYKGIDNKTDEKNSIPGELNILENGVFKETGKISKRNGFTSTTLQTNSGNISEGISLANFNNELLQITSSDVLAFSEAENIWLGRGRDYQLSDQTSAIFSNDKQQQNVECKVFNDIELYVWEEYPNGGLKYSIIDHLNGSILISNALLDEYGSRPKVIVFQDSFVIIYYNTGKLYSKIINPQTLFTISDSNLIVSDINSQNPQFDVLSPKLYDGLFYLAYSKNNLSNTGLIYFSDANGARLNSYNFTRASSQAINIWEDNLNNIWVLGCSKANVQHKYTLSVCGIRTKGASSTSVSSGYTISVTNEYQPVYKVFGFKGELTGENTIFYELSPLNENPGFTSKTEYGNYINKAIVTIDGQIFSDKLFKRGISIYSKPFLYNNINFFLGVTNSTFQSTYYLFDELGIIASRSNVNQGGGSKASALDGVELNTCTDSIIDSDGKILIPLQIKNSFVSDNNTIYLPTGINKVNYNFNNNSIGLSNITLGNNLNISGGIFKNYDGFNLVENNFFQYPENVEYSSIPFTVILTQLGTSILPQIVNILFFEDANRILQSSYFTIGSLNQPFYVWFNVDSKGVDPMIGLKTGIEVKIDSDDSNETVLDAIIEALPTSLFDVVKNGSGLTITNQIIGSGVISPPTSGDMNSGGITDGVYLYSAIYEWIDSFGQIVRSAPSVPISVTISDSTSHNVTIIVPTLRLTEKNDVKIVIYRTENLGDTVFYRVTELLNPLQNNKNVDFVTFIDTKSDFQILSNDSLYTLGGVVPNAAPPSSKFSALYKNRIFIGGLEDGNLMWFSKENSTGSSVEFSEYLTFKCDPHFGNITALGVLDDKLIIFKENGMFYLAGSGPSNTGDGNDYNTGFNNISTDVGCIDPKSVVITKLGLMFKSKKGIYLLDRGLNTTYIGANVESYNNLTITSAIVNPINNQVRFTTKSGTMLVYDYYTGQWSTFTKLPAVDALFVNSNYYLLKPNGVVYKESEGYTDDGEFIQLKIQTGWLSFAKLQGYQRVRRALILGSYLGKHKLNVSFYYDFNKSPPQFTEINAGTLIGDNNVWGSEEYWGDSDVWGGDFVPYEFNIHLTRQKCTSFKIEIYDSQEDDFTEGFDISNFAFEIGVKQGTNKLAPKNKFGNRT